jgi:hypothetical protein
MDRVYVMSLRIELKVSGSCPRHPRYDPEKTGEGGIKAGCGLCYSLLALFRDTQMLERKLQNFQRDRAARAS